jgi:hypothetical protein
MAMPARSVKTDDPLDDFCGRVCPVSTQHPIDEAGQPTIAARDEILAIFAMRLAASR